MGIYFIVILGILLSISLYKRYFPVLGIPCVENHFKKTSNVVVDIRDYNIGVNNNQSDIRIPYAYLKRYIREIPMQKLHVIANDRLELNLGIRLLRSKGYQVDSYHIVNCPCSKKE
jgi:hypothetical protein